MAETTKRTTNISASKNRKSRNDIVRAAIEMYLNEKNYTVSVIGIEFWSIIDGFSRELRPLNLT